jgi:hypothetical protein
MEMSKDRKARKRNGLSPEKTVFMKTPKRKRIMPLSAIPRDVPKRGE